MPNPATIGASQDYATVAAWVSGEAGDFSGVGVVEGRLINQAHAMSGNVAITGASNLSASDHWLLTCESANRHAGIPSLSKAYMDWNGSLGNFQDGLRLSDDYTEVEWVQVYRAYGGNYSTVYCVGLHGAGSSFHNSLIFEAGAGRCHGSRITTASGVFHNNLIRDVDRDAMVIGAGCEVYNNTIYNFGQDGGYHGVDIGASGLTLKNNIIMFGGSGASGNCIDGTPDVSSNNITEDATGEITNQDDTDVDFVDPDADDFHLASESSSAHDAGAELGSPYNIDIDGNDRGASNWDIGFHQLQGGGGGDPLIPRENVGRGVGRGVGGGMR